MIIYLLKRTARIPATLLAVATLTFGLIRLLPGGPFTRMRIRMLQRGVPVETVNARIEALQNIRPDAPLWEQYIQWLGAAVQLDLGQSISIGDPVIQVVARAIPWTVFIVLTSTVLMFIIGVLIGAVQAYWEGSMFDNLFSGVSTLLESIPYYIVAVALVFFFGHEWEFFPTQYAVDLDATGFEYVLSVLHHGALPIISFTLAGIGGMALGMRGNAIQVLGEDYVEVARLRGLPDRRIATQYVAKNAVLPMYTSLLLLIGFRLGGTVVLEQIFSYPGLGYYMISAINANDYPLMMGCFLVIAATLVVAVYIADLTYGLIDPRISVGESDEF